MFLNCTLFDWNIKDIPDIVNLLNDFPKLEIRFQHYQDWNDQSNIKFIDIFGIDVSYFNDKRIHWIGRDDFDYKDCLWNKERIQIDENGYVRLCCLKTGSQGVLAHSRHTDKIEKIIKEKTVCINNNKAPASVCTSCSFKLLNNFNKNIKKMMEDCNA